MVVGDLYGQERYGRKYEEGRQQSATYLRSYIGAGATGLEQQSGRAMTRTYGRSIHGDPYQGPGTEGLETGTMQVGGGAGGGAGGRQRGGWAETGQAMYSGVRGGAGAASAASQARPDYGGNISELGNRLAKLYGIDMGGTPIVDEQGNFLRLPKNEEEALKFNSLAQAISNEMNRQYEGKAVAALQSQAGLVMDRRRGSLALLQQGTYAQMADLYANTDVSAGNFDDYLAMYQGKRAERIAELMVKAAKYKMYGDIVAGVGSLIGGIL